MIYTMDGFSEDWMQSDGGIRDAVNLLGCRPSDGGHDWREDAVRLLSARGLDESDFMSPVNEGGYDMNRQAVFEHLAIRLSSANLFWFTDEDGSVDCERDEIYLGQCLSMPGTFVGCDPDFPGYDQIRMLCGLSNTDCHDTLESLCEAVALNFDHPERIYFISDTHFSQIKAKMVWGRPFEDIMDMDLSMISNWNKTVHSQDTVYHLGDFGEPYALSLLNFGKMLFVNGNYENKRKVDMGPAFEEDGRVEVIPSGSICTLDGFDYRLCHEPCPEGECGDDGNFWLYGHIHSSQRIKRNGINVGADCNGYWPVPATEIERLRMQVRNFADDNCFCEWVNGREDAP